MPTQTVTTSDGHLIFEWTRFPSFPLSYLVSGSAHVERDDAVLLAVPLQLVLHLRVQERHGVVVAPSSSATICGLLALGE